MTDSLSFARQGDKLNSDFFEEGIKQNKGVRTLCWL